MRDTTGIGNVTEGVVLGELMKAGYIVLVPFGAQSGYDLVIEKDGRFYKVQCKTGRLRDGAVLFNLYTVVKDSKTGKTQGRTYEGMVDYFGVYCPENKKAYLVKNENLGSVHCTMRLEPAKNGQTKGVRWAKDYEIGTAELAQR